LAYKDVILMREQVITTRKAVLRFRGRVVTAMAIAAAMALAPSLRSAAAAEANPVLAEIGSHKITEQQVDEKIKVQLYDARKDALDNMIDQYLLERAAKKEKLSVADYLKREVDDKVSATVNDAVAKKFYEAKKDKIAALKKVPYAQIKDRLIAALRQHEDETRREELLAQLRKQAGIKILLQPPRIQLAIAGRPSLGPKDAPVTVVEFGDFQCPFCKRAEGTLKAMREKYGDKVRLVFMDFPLSFHNHAMQAANAARCAQEQNKFWPYHDALFADQSKLAPADLKATAKKLGLNTKEFDACFDKGKYNAAISKDVAEGRKLEVSGTPTFFIDGRQLVGAQPLPKFEEIIDEDLAQAGNHGMKKTAEAN
jgi:protein-disulfide isomerase